MSEPGERENTREKIRAAIDDAAEDSPQKRLAREAAGFPHLPGVYIFKDDEERVLYVGKARDLRKRVVSYFRALGNQPVKTRAMVSKARALEYMITNSEKEAFLLESSLIKKHRPRYNVDLRDDKNYPALRIDPRAEWPRIEVVRQLKKDGAVYFGPFTSVHGMRETLKTLSRVFPLRHCKSKKLQPRERPCLNHALGRCLGACAGRVTQEEYRKAVDEVILFLQGKTDTLQRRLKERMEEAAEEMKFEKAAQYRDRLRDVEQLLEKQHIVSDRFLDQDVIGIHGENGQHGLAVLFVRRGMLVGRRYFDLMEAQGRPENLVTGFIERFYGEHRHVPEEVVVPFLLEDADFLESWLSELKSRRVRVWAAQRGERRKLLELAERNAREAFRGHQKAAREGWRLVEKLQDLLDLPRPPMRMACVDISNLQGRHAVGSVVVFQDGRPDTASYRRYKVHTKAEPDDPAMMEEIVERFVTEEPELAAGLDLLMVDGGRGQVNRIHDLLRRLELADDLPLAGIAKERENDRGEEGRGLYEKIYFPRRSVPVFLTRHEDVLHLLQRLRDEAHRFAITFYKKRHRKEFLSSELDSIPGVGPRRRQLLLQHFDSLDALKNAPLEQLRATPGLPKSTAEALHKHFHGEDENPNSGSVEKS